MSEVVRRRVVVTGRVQGVFFRDSIRREAAARGVSGWALNRHDGALEAVFEGEPQAVGAVVAYCRAGPPQARVDAVAVSEEEPGGESGFRIR